MKRRETKLKREMKRVQLLSLLTSKIWLALSTTPRTLLMSMPYSELIDIICLSVKLATVSASKSENAALYII